MSARLFAAALGALLLAGCSAGTAAPQPGEVYPMALADARRIVLATELPFPMQGTSAAGVSARAADDGTVALAILDPKGAEQLRYTATLVPETATTTRVSVSYAGAGDNPKVAVNGAAHPEIVDLFLKAMREQVDSQLDGRPFDNLSIGPELMVALAANAESIGADMRKAGEDLRRRDAANIDAAYAAEAKGAY